MNLVGSKSPSHALKIPALSTLRPICYNAYKSYTLEIVYEINPFDGHQHAPAGGERKASQTHGESAWMDPQRRQCALGGGRLAPVRIWIHRLSRFTCGSASLPSREYARRMGGHAARPDRKSTRLNSSHLGIS